VIARNRGDSQDALDLNAERVTLSLGGEIYQDLLSESATAGAGWAAPTP
jgi:hypothetical protein